MSGLAGFVEFQAESCSTEENRTQRSVQMQRDKGILYEMGQKLQHRGRGQQGMYQSCGCNLMQCSAIATDKEEERQPLVRIFQGEEGVLALDGILWNAKELRLELNCHGIHLVGESDAELLLAGLMKYGIHYLKKVNGMFAFAWWQRRTGTLCLGRDHVGIRPLFYAVRGTKLVFASEMKALFAHPDVPPVINEQVMGQILAIGPAKIPGKGVFEGIEEVGAGSVLLADETGIRQQTYWQLENKPHTESYAQTVLHVRELLEDAIKRQFFSRQGAGLHPAAFLSGGLDSSIVTAVCAKWMAEQGEQLDTYGFEFEGSREFFQSNAFQPSLDSPFAEIVVRECHTNHRILTCGNETLVNALWAAMRARDLPGMADVDASLVYFCSQVKADLVLTGEGADEIFGGYPWYHREIQSGIGFPWTPDLQQRKGLLRDDVVERLDLDSFARQAYEDSIGAMPVWNGETEGERRHKQLMWLTLKWFGATLIDRTDRAAASSGLDARMPFLDYRLVEYLWNVPWEQKAPDGEAKGLLRAAVKGWLPEEVRIRKKSPYPKTYHPEYQQMLGRMLCEELKQPDAPLLQWLDPKKVEAFLQSPANVSKPWFGQLMAGPQLLAYWLQIGWWLKQYRISG